MDISIIKSILLRNIYLFVKLFPRFGVWVYKCALLCIEFLMVFSTVVLKILMRRKCLNYWRHYVHKWCGAVNIASFTYFKQVVELLVVVFINDPLVNHFLLFICKCSWINSKQFLIFFVTEVIFQIIWETYRFLQFHWNNYPVSI